MRALYRYLFGSVFRRGATLLTFLTLASYGLGLVRDILFARFLGASRLLDVYNAAFIIPDVLLNVFVAGALTAAFVPIFTHLMAHGDRTHAEELAGTMLRAAPLTMGVIAAIAFIFMPALAALVAPGFVEADHALLVRMSRLLLLSPILFAISNTLGGVLVSLERFFGYGLSPVLYNLGIIGGVFLIEPFGPLGLVVGVLIGALLHMTTRLLALRRIGFRPNWTGTFKEKNFLQVVFLMVPRMAGQPVEQLTFFVFTALASSLATGSIAILNFARNFQSVPVSVFGIAFATAAFSSLSRKAALGDRKGFTAIIRETGSLLLLITAASALFYVFAGRFVVDLLLGGGAFGPDAVRTTARLLAVFAIAIPAESFMHILVRSFYALKDTWTPVLVRLPGIGLIYILATSLMPTFGLNALGASYAFAITVEVLVLGLLLRHKMRRLGSQVISGQ